jgi:hypothetical protein
MQDAPKTDRPPKTDATEATKPPAPSESEPGTTAQAAPLTQDKTAETGPLTEPVKNDPPDSLKQPTTASPDTSDAKVDGLVTRDLSDARGPVPEKPATTSSSIPSPAPAKVEPQPPVAATNEPRGTQRIPDLASLGLSSNATTAGTICPTCGHRNRPGILLCENCGTNLATGRQSGVGTRDLMREQEKGEGQLDAEAQQAVDTAGGANFTEEMVLRIEIEGGSTPMLVYPKQEIIMGRRDPNTGGMPDVDLTAYAGYRMGVSRRHAAIRLQDKQLHVSDLGSSNGTFLNGTRLNAHRPYQLKDGDEVRLGQMILRLYFQSNKDRK